MSNADRVPASMRRCMASEINPDSSRTILRTPCDEEDGEEVCVNAYRWTKSTVLVMKGIKESHESSSRDAGDLILIDNLIDDYCEEEDAEEDVEEDVSPHKMAVINSFSTPSLPLHFIPYHLFLG